jgi:hypothetical protein
MNTARKLEPEVHVHDVSKLKGRLKLIGGSMSDDWNNVLANQTVQTLWLKSADAEEINRQRHAAVDVLIGMAPRDEFEGMAAAQLVACHNASMECYRRAMIGEQTFEGRRENLNQANKLSRTYATLLEALNRHRGKGAQKSRSSTSTFTPADKRLSAWLPRGVGINRNHRINPMQSNLPMHLSKRCGAKTRSGSPCQSPAMPNGRCRMHGGPSPGAPKGNKNALKHGRYSAEAIARRRSISALIRSARRQCAS